MPLLLPEARERARLLSDLHTEVHLDLTSTDHFTDDRGNQHEQAINRLASAGIAGDCAAGRYCPAGTVTRGQMAAFLYRALAP